MTERIDSEAAPPSARQALREQTAEAHERMHGHPFFAPFEPGRMTLDAYKRILRALYGFHAALETELFRASAEAGVEAVMAGRAHSAELAADLESVGFSAAAIQAIPRWDSFRVSGRGDLLGTIYVREGSLLGSAVLAKRLDTILGGDRGRRFLTSHSRNPGAWQRLIEEIEVAGSDGLLPSMVSGANRTFRAMEVWLNGNR